MKHSQGNVLSAGGALLAVAALAGCGGGGGGDSNATPNTRKQITAESLASCPTDGMSPVDMDKLSCLVGHADGVSSRQTNPKACSLDVSSDGTITITVADQGSRTYSLSKGVGTFKDTPLQAKAFSEYQGRADIPGAAAGFAAETWMLGSTSGSESPDGVAVPVSDREEVKISYFGPSGNASGTPPVLIVGAFKDASRWIPDMLSCEVRW